MKEGSGYEKACSAHTFYSFQIHFRFIPDICIAIKNEYNEISLT